MNLPNKLTIARVCLIPFFVVFLLNESISYGKYIAVGIFILASLTDTLDGYIARKYNLVTNFGKFMDPLADKLLVSAALICFVQMNLIPTWIVIIIISREFIVTGFRLVASDSGIVLAAGFGGKIKTVTQMVMSVLLIIHLEHPVYQITEQIFIYASLVLTIYSMMDYLIRNKEVLATK